MTNYSDHPVFQQCGKYQPDPDFYSRDQIVARFSRLSPVVREQLLIGCEAYASQDDGSTVRKKSQLLSLNRHLSGAHFALLKAGR
jgi:hypothetical protein